MRNACWGTVDKFVKKRCFPLQRLIKSRSRRGNKGWRPEMGAIRLSSMILPKVLNYRGADQPPKIAIVTTFRETHKREYANDVHRIDIGAHRYPAGDAPAIPISIKGTVIGRLV